MMSIYVGKYYDFMDIGKYVIFYIYLYYDYLMSCMRISGYHLRLHPRHDENSLETSKNVLAVHLVYRHVHIWSYRSPMYPQSTAPTHADSLRSYIMLCYYYYYYYYYYIIWTS